MITITGIKTIFTNYAVSKRYAKILMIFSGWNWIAINLIFAKVSWLSLNQKERTQTMISDCIQCEVGIKGKGN